MPGDNGGLVVDTVCGGGDVIPNRGSPLVGDNDFGDELADDATHSDL